MRRDDYRSVSAGRTPRAARKAWRGIGSHVEPVSTELIGDEQRGGDPRLLERAGYGAGGRWRHLHAFEGDQARDLGGSVIVHLRQAHDVGLHLENERSGICRGGCPALSIPDQDRVSRSIRTCCGEPRPVLWSVPSVRSERHSVSASLPCSCAPSGRCITSSPIDGSEASKSLVVLDYYRPPGETSALKARSAQRCGLSRGARGACTQLHHRAARLRRVRQEVPCQGGRQR